MMTRSSKRRADKAAAQDETQTPPDDAADAEPLGDDASPAELAAIAETVGAVAAADHDLAARNRARAAEVIAAAQAEADGILDEAAAIAQGLDAEAIAAERHAEPIEQRCALLGAAAGGQLQGGEADQRVAELEAEREQLAGQIADLDSKIEQLAVQRQDTDLKLAAARAAADVDAIGMLRGRLAGIDEVRADLDAQRAAIHTRFTAVGDGEVPGELAEARRAADGLRAAVRQALNAVWPDRPEAVHDALWGELTATAAANKQRIAEEAEEVRPRPSNIVRV